MEKINVNKRIVNQTNIFQVTNDIIVPDIKPDIVSIIAINGIPYIYKQECENGRVKVDGSMDAYIIYLSVDGDTRSIQTTFNFSNILENKDIKENSNLRCKLDIKAIDSKILNERKISAITTISIEYLISEIQTIEITDEFLNEIPMVQKQEECVKVKALVGSNIGKTSIKENIDIENLDEISEILKVDVNVENGEQKISYNKILTKGECNISIIYMTEDNRIGNVKNTFQLMSFIDLDNVKENDKCFVEYNIKNMLFKINNKDDHSISAQIDFEIYCEAYEERELNIIKDAYSLSNDINISYKDIELDNFNNDSDEIIDIYEKIKIEDIKRILTIEQRKLSILKRDNSNLEGEIHLIVYYEVSNKSGLNTKELKIPFIIKEKIQNEFSIVCKNIDNNLNGEELNLNIKLLVKNNIGELNRLSIIDNIKIVDKPEVEDYSVVVYMVKKNDTIWKIAKNFKVTTDSIIKINNLDNPDMIYPGDKLYVLR